MTTQHQTLVLDLIQLQPGTPEHAATLATLKRMEEGNPLLEFERVEMMSRAAPKVGQLPPALRGQGGATV